MYLHSKLFIIKLWSNSLLLNRLLSFPTNFIAKAVALASSSTNSTQEFCLNMLIHNDDKINIAETKGDITMLCILTLQT